MQRKPKNKKIISIKTQINANIRLFTVRNYEINFEKIMILSEKDKQREKKRKDISELVREK